MVNNNISNQQHDNNNIQHSFNYDLTSSLHVSSVVVDHAVREDGEY